MASTSKKQSTQSPVPQRKSRKNNKAGLRPSQNDELTVVGIGASAGGLKALRTFFGALPSDTGMAYVVITHLHPEHESQLAEILQKDTQMPVRQVTELMKVESDHVYVIPPNRRLVMEDGQIDTSEFREPRGQRAPIDYFFHSLAQSHPDSVGVILSGGGTDGAVGVKAIKEEGGLLMVQHPEEAEYDSMPRAAIATGLADVVLPVKELAVKLVEYIQQRPSLPLEAGELQDGQLEVIRRILAHVHTRTGHDFTQYKRSTLLRRIQRRMQINGLLTLETYLDYLRNTPTEAVALFNDILIGVTSFFRDRESWQELDETRSNVLMVQLEAEVRRLREQLQSSIEEYESSNEELKASNEELQSINEEYRSATEELETSKEELQSVNEELQTVNNELKSKLEEILRSHNDLENLMSATEIAMLFLDRELHIRQYTPGMQELFNIMPGDRGRPIRHLTHTLRYSQFIEDAEEVLRNLVPSEREVRGENDRWFLLRIRPYRTVDDRINGVIFTSVDITRLKQAEAELVELNATLEQRVEQRTRELDKANQKTAQARDLFYALFHANPIPTALTRMEDDVFINVNVEFLHYFEFQRDKIIGHGAQEIGLGLGLGQKPETHTREDFIAYVKQEGKIGSYETEIERPSGERRNILVSAQYINLDNIDALITTFIDITDRVRAEQQIRALATELTATEQAERHRLAQVLHDDLQQRLFAVQMQMSFLKDAYERNDLQTFAVDFPQLEEWLAESIKVTRQLSVDLSPPILHGEGLFETIIWLAAQMDEQYGLKARVRSGDRLPQLDEKVRVLVFYAIRELLFNVVKHAGILEATVAFMQNQSHLSVTVGDSGKGFDSQALLSDPKRSHGLLSLRHRLNLLGCSMQINSQSGNGTEVVIEIPIEQMDAGL